jgi:hypothetical protein
MLAQVDATRLERALLNLLANAQQYGRDGGLVRLVLAACMAKQCYQLSMMGQAYPSRVAHAWSASGETCTLGYRFKRPHQQRG